MRTFTVQKVPVRVTHGEREVNEMLATYGDGDAQVTQQALWKQEGWKFDEGKKEWFFMHPVWQIVVSGNPETAIPSRDECSPEEYGLLENALLELFGNANDDIEDAGRLAGILSAGLQYKTRPSLKKKSKGRASLNALEETMKLNMAFLTKFGTSPAKMAEYIAAGVSGQAAFLKAQDLG